jgi:N4-gp56 family major capsid protein
MALPAAASVVTSGLNQYPTIYFDRKAVGTLYSNLFMYPACDLRTCPDNSGTVVQLYGYTKMAANTTPATEGTPGAGQALTDVTRQITLDNFVDYSTISNKVVRTNLVDTIADAASLLGYRGALSVDTVISTAVDTAANSDSVSRIDVNTGTYMSAFQSRKAAFGLRSKDIKTKDNGKFFGVIHSLQAFDLVNDSAAGGFLDLQKYSDATASKNPALVGIQGTFIGNVGGVEWHESNAVPTETNWQSTANNAYHAYVFGREAFFASSLGNTNLNQANFQVKINRYDAGSISSDPAGQILASAAYNYFFGVAKRPGTINGFRRIRSESSLG